MRPVSVRPGPCAAIALLSTACTAASRQPPPVTTAAETVHEAPSHESPSASPELVAANAGELAGIWVVQAPPPLITTQLTPGCHTLLQNIAATGARLTFSGTEVAFHADSLSNVAMAIDPHFGWSRSADPTDHVVIENAGYQRPPHVWIPCGAMPTELRIAPSGEQLTSNVAHCEPCAHEAAIDGLVGVTWTRQPVP